MTKTYCDKCGKEKNIENIKINSSALGGEKINMDLCIECRLKLINYIKLWN